MRIITVLYNEETENLIMFNRKPNLTFPCIHTNYEEKSVSAALRLLNDLGVTECAEKDIVFLYRNTAVGRKHIDSENTYEVYFVSIRSYRSDKLIEMSPRYDFSCNTVRDFVIMGQVLSYIDDIGSKISG